MLDAIAKEWMGEEKKKFPSKIIISIMNMKITISVKTLDKGEIGNGSNRWSQVQKRSTREANNGT